MKFIPRRTWVTIWNDGTIDRRYFTHRAAVRRQQEVNSMNGLFYAWTGVTVTRLIAKNI